MSKEIVKKNKDKDAYLKIYEDALPDLMTQNVRLQKRALNIIEEKIDNVTAVQAATIYGILWDKCNVIMARKGVQNNQINMYFGDTTSDVDAENLMSTVLKRMQGNKETDIPEEKMVQADVEIVDNTIDDSN